MGFDESESGPPVEPPEHPLLASAQRASQTPVATVALTGLFGHAEDPEKRRVYLSAQLNQYAEFRAADVVRYDEVPAADSPIPGQDATRVTLKRGSPVAFTHTRTESLSADDQFDLDARYPARGPWQYAFDTGYVCRTMFETIGCPVPRRDA